MLDCLHEEATVWDIFQPQLVTRRELEAYVASDFEQSASRGPLSMKLRDFVTTVWGGCAIVRFYLDYRYAPPNETHGNGRITCVLRHCGQRGWLVVHVHEGHVPAGIPPLQADWQLP
jgi:ketosteroid isomerase-like protein